MNTTKPSLPNTFISYATDILADTNKGLMTSEIELVMRKYAVEASIEIPHPSSPFKTLNKRTALAENIQAFKEPDQYRILVELCDHPEVLKRNGDAARKLKLQLMSQFCHLAAASLGTEVNEALIEQTQHWLAAYPDVFDIYSQALQKYRALAFRRNLLDDLRLAFEKLVQTLLNNSRSLENQLSELGKFMRNHGASVEFSNMLVKLVDYYAKYQNTYVKHNSAVKEDEIEFMLEVTSAFMKHLIRLGNNSVGSP
jgi:hypothetical protein